MRILALLVTFGCVTQDPSRDALKAAIEKVRGQTSYRVRYKAVMKAPNSDPMVIEGESVWVAPGVLYVHYKASGGDEKRIVRVGERVWIYHEFVEEWVTAEEMGNKGAGRGVQNPDEVLAVLQKHAEKVEGAGGGEYAVTMTGPEIEKMMKEQSLQGSFDWKESRASAKVAVGADGLITKFASQAELKSTDPEISGTMRYDADVEVVSYARDTSLSFTVKDAKGKPKAVPLSQEIQDAVKAQKK